MFERKDAKNWARWKFYPGAMTILIPRFLIGGVLILVLTLLVSLLLIGHNLNEPLTSGCRKWFIRKTYVIFVNLVAILCWFTSLAHTYD